MTRASAVVLDSQPIVALLLGEPTAAEVEGLLRTGAARISTVSIAEVLDVFTRREGLPWDDVEIVLAGLPTKPSSRLRPMCRPRIAQPTCDSVTSAGETAGFPSATASWSRPLDG